MAGGRLCFQLLLHELMAVIILISKRMAAIALGFLLLHSGLIILGDAGGIIQRHCPEKERHALISFKRELIDDFGMLSSWATHHDDVHNKNCCDWRGVLRSYSTGHVIALHLPGYIQQSPYSRYNRVYLGANITSLLLELEHLKHLDLSNNFLHWILPDFTGSLAKLEYLNLSHNSFIGTLSYQGGNLSNLRTLDLGWNSYIDSPSLEWLSDLHLLRYLDLSEVDLGRASDWQQAICNLPSLTHLNLDMCELSQVLQPSIASHRFNSSRSLVFLSLSANNLNSSFIYAWEELFNSSRNSLKDVDLSNNNLQDPIPEAFRRLCNLKSLSLYGNQLNQKLSGLFQTLYMDDCGGNSSSLEMLYLHDNNLSGSLPNLARFSSLRHLDLSFNQLNAPFPQDFGFPSSLVVLDLTNNKIMGPLPKLMACSSLVKLRLGNNQMNGTIPKDLGRLSQLEVFDVSSNYFEGMISEAHFSSLSKLKYLDLSHNTLTLNLSFDWVPPFQLDFIFLSGCKLGPHVPKWLRNQNKYSQLDISSAAISEPIPKWFWDQSRGLDYLDLSHNHISARLPNSSPTFCNEGAFIDLSFNHFIGPIIPPFLRNASMWNLSNNKFSGSLSLLCETSGTFLVYLDLSNNLLSGKLPNCWMQFKSLRVLHLENNKFSGKIPSSIGSLSDIESLHLHHNDFNEELPSSLQNCKRLVTLDLGENQFFGTIPTWIGHNLVNLRFLSLRSNQFHGSIPLNLCHLSIIQILDLSQNNISGTMPRCLYNLTSMMKKEISKFTLSFNVNYWCHSKISCDQMLENVFLIWKGKMSEFINTLVLLRSIDLSSNKLDGEIPREITILKELVNLNLSRNLLNGTIPSKIGELESLDSLDLSRNQLFGEIPATLSQISRLSVLDLSCNKLSGKIPTGTQLQGFDASVYIGNPHLCGLPLLKRCVGDQLTSNQPHVNGHEDNESTQEDKTALIVFPWFYEGLGLGFVVGFWGVCGTLVLNTSWRIAYFQFLNNMKDRLFVMVAIYSTRFGRRIQALNGHA